jgi:hypothetical protein
LRCLGSTCWPGWLLNGVSTATLESTHFRQRKSRCQEMAAVRDNLIELLAKTDTASAAAQAQGGLGFETTVGARWGASCG